MMFEHVFYLVLNFAKPKLTAQVIGRAVPYEDIEGDISATQRRYQKQRRKLYNCVFGPSLSAALSTFTRK